MTVRHKETHRNKLACDENGTLMEPYKSTSFHKDTGGPT